MKSQVIAPAGARRKGYARLLTTTVLAAGVFASGPSFAQDADAEDESLELEEISITGSRIRRSNVTSSTPLSVISNQTIELSGKVNLIDLLQEMPEMGATANLDSTSGWIFEGGHSFTNLRNLGWQRTLTLVDGRRAIGSSDGDFSFVFDVGTLPVEMVDRIEVTTGGASAVYGSDAVAGVVNYILKDDYEGISVKGEAGVSSRGDAERWKTSITVGNNFADDRGNAVFHFAVDDQAELYTGDRDVGQCGLRWRNASEFAEEQQYERIASECGWKWADWSGDFYVWTPGQNYYHLINNEMVFRGHSGQEGDADDSNIVRNGSWTRDFGATPWARRIDIMPQRKYVGYAAMNFDLTDSITLKTQARYSRTKATSATEPVFHYWGGTDISENPYAPQELLDIAGDYIWYTKLYWEFGPRTTDFTRQFYAISAGLEGEFDNGWNWDLYYKTGGTDQQQVNRNQAHGGRWAQSRDVIADPVTGDPVCRDQSNGCVPFNIFGPVSQEAVDWVRIDQLESKRNTQQILSGSVAGSLFDLPAGELGAAVGFEYRRDHIDYDPDSSYVNQENIFSSLRAPLDETDTVKEAFAELLVPVLKDSPIAKSLEVELAVRYADYKFHGGNTSWKAGVNWAVNDNIRLRGVLATAKRAPSLGELRAPGSTGAQSVTDPCDNDQITMEPNYLANCRAIGIPDGWDSNADGLRVTVKTSGNPALKPETAESLTLGAVITPSFLPKLTFSADYFDIDLTNVITTLGANRVLDLCYKSENMQNEACNLVHRASNGDLTMVEDVGLNAAISKVRGVDFKAQYEFDLGRRGELMLNASAQYLIDSTYQSDADDENTFSQDAGEINDPKWRGIVDLIYSYNDLTVSFSTKWWQGGYVDNNHRDDNWYSHPKAPGHIVNDLYVSYNLTDDLMMYVGIDNVFDNDTPNHINTAYGTSMYGNVGRYFFGGVRVKM
ncbi:MAG: TonB-dependent receptor [Alphaproteobacteria bacterium]|nr:TonB-dependent receptor [Alphaproteobacteria bacterium]